MRLQIWNHEIWSFHCTLVPQPIVGAYNNAEIESESSELHDTSREDTLIDQGGMKNTMRDRQLNCRP